MSFHKRQIHWSLRSSIASETGADPYIPADSASSQCMGHTTSRIPQPRLVEGRGHAGSNRGRSAISAVASG